MLEKIKLSYFILIVFNYLNERIKLKIIKYNEAFKNRLNISLINYKLFTGKYLIYETNGIGKEYDYDDKLLFDGEYKNGERNGKGKEYNQYGKLIYEGEYKIGERNGKGKEYDFDDKLIFEGEYKNGKRWNGKGFDKYKNIVYELKDGKGIVSELNKNTFSLYEGEYLNEEKNGTGK